jgi:AraC-like DNA-binding protein
LEARIGDVRQVVARSIKRLEAEHGLTSSYLAMLPTYADRLDAAAAELVRDHVLDLVAVSLAKALDRGKPRLSSARSLVLVNVRVAIETRLSDPSLDAATVAAAAGVSVRYANAVLAEDGTSIMRLIWSRRLERCRRALANTAGSHRLSEETSLYAKLDVLSPPDAGRSNDRARRKWTESPIPSTIKRRMPRPNRNEQTIVRDHTNAHGPWHEDVERAFDRCNISTRETNDRGQFP